jgi:hypothetical protein
MIDAIARARLKYETIIEEQSQVLSSDRLAYQAAMAQFQQSPQVSQHWEPHPGHVDQYMAYCNTICGLVPKKFDKLSSSLQFH